MKWASSLLPMSLFISRLATDLGLKAEFDSVVSDLTRLEQAMEGGSRKILYTQSIVDMNHFAYGRISAMCGRAAYASAGPPCFWCSKAMHMLL
jgi:hypothetical protein